MEQLETYEDNISHFNYLCVSFVIIAFEVYDDGCSYGLGMVTFEPNRCVLYFGTLVGFNFRILYYKCWVLWKQA